MPSSLAIKGKLDGLAELTAKLSGARRTIRNKVLRKAVNAATQEGLNGVKGSYKLSAGKAKRGHKKYVRSGQLKRSLGRKTKTYDSGVVVGVIGPRKGYAIVWNGQKIDPVKYAHLVNADTRAHSLAKGARLRKGQQPPGPGHPGTKGIQFMQLGWAAAKTRAEARAIDVLREEIPKAMQAS